jgi:glucose uptake protein GlcU
VGAINFALLVTPPSLGYHKLLTGKVASQMTSLEKVLYVHAAGFILCTVLLFPVTKSKEVARQAFMSMIPGFIVMNIGSLVMYPDAGTFFKKANTMASLVFAVGATLALN